MVALPPGHTAIDISTVAKVKSNGSIKWRFCPKGFKQIDGKNYDSDEVYAPVVNKPTMRLMLSIGNSVPEMALDDSNHQNAITFEGPSSTTWHV